MIDYFPRTEIVPKSLAGGGEGSLGDPCILHKKAPSVVPEGGPPMGYMGGVIGVGSGPTPPPPIENPACEIDVKMKRCKVHSCIVKSIDVSSTKWEWIERQKKYGNVRRKTKKWICRGWLDGRVEQKTFPDQYARDSGGTIQRPITLIQGLVTQLEMNEETVMGNGRVDGGLSETKVNTSS